MPFLTRLENLWSLFPLKKSHTWLKPISFYQLTTLGPSAQNLPNIRSTISLNVYKSQRSGKKTALVFLLDFTRTFDNVSNERLLQNFCSKRIHSWIVTWIDNFLTGQSTVLHTNKHSTEKINIFTGIFQSFRLSPILFLLYNTPLLEEVEKEKNISATGVVDDIAILVEEKSCKENSTVVLNHHDKICKPWAQRHESKFTSKKYQLSHFMIKKPPI